VRISLTEIEAGDIPQILVYNKIDRLEDTAPRHDQPHDARERVWLSAQTGAGVGTLKQVLSRRFSDRQVVGELLLRPEDGRLRARLHALDAVRGERSDEAGWHLQLDLPLAVAERLAAESGGHALQPLLVGPGAPTFNPDEPST